MSCQKCNGTGMVDSGGVQPWGEPILVECDCLYRERDAWELDQAGGYYSRHVMAMTSEGLHSKGDIAAELGYRDMRIDQLEAEWRAQEERAKMLKRILSTCVLLSTHYPILIFVCVKLLVQ